VSLIFKKIFGEKGNEDILISFINAVLKRTKKEPIVEVEIIDNKQLTILVKKFNSVGSVVYGSNDSKEVDMIDDLLNYKYIADWKV
jgi:hypothetical protein